MTDTMDITEYLAKGGRLTNPANVPTRYRAELMKIMATFVDTEPPPTKVRGFSGS